MPVLTELIELRELDVECRHCGWIEARTLSWLGAKRDMACPECAGVIVLNTSEFRARMASLRRQVSSLHRQLIDAIPAPDTFMHRESSLVRAAAPPSDMHLALSQVYSETTGRSANTGREGRSNRR